MSGGAIPIIRTDRRDYEVNNRKTCGMAAVASAVIAAPVFAQERVVNVYNWSDYIDSSILDDFTKETGIKVVYDTFDSNETLETKLLAGGTGYDVVVPTVPFPAAPDRRRRLPEARQVEAAEPHQHVGCDESASPPYDPGNEYTVDYMWGTTGIGYNVER